MADVNVLGSLISIHAPTRGATGLCRFLARIFTISIHAPTRGATFRMIIIITVFSFQSTLLQEERHNHPVREEDYFKISIHAPTRGATYGI